MTLGSSAYALETYNRDFCSYWGAFVGKIILSAIMLGIVGMILTVLVVGIIVSPVGTLALIIVTGVIMLTIFGLAFVFIEGPGIVKRRLESKGKYCSRVDYTD
jgi:ATP/ADP translocase